MVEQEHKQEILPKFDFCQSVTSPLVLVERWSEQFKEVIRYRNPDGSRTKLMGNFDENNWEHTINCVCYARHLAIRFPELRNMFDFPNIIFPLLYFHEADELIKGDHAKQPDAGGRVDLDTLPTTVDKYYDWYMKSFFESFFGQMEFNTEESQKWISRLEEMEKPSTCTNRNLLFAKLIDWMQGNFIVAAYGNFSNEESRNYQVSVFRTYSGPLFKRILEIIYSDSLAAAKIIINQMLIHCYQVFAQRGVYLPV